jgi:indolepyruvate ferredoxin oxidoreductase
VKHDATTMVVNTDEFLPGEFTRNADFSLPSERLKRTIVADAGAGKTHFVDATRIANALFGNSIGANMFLVGFAYQLGAIPVSAAAIERAVELNGEAVAMNRAAFHWGRRAAVDRAAVEKLAQPAPAMVSDAERLSETFDEAVERRVKFLTAYQNAAYAQHYRAKVDQVKAAEAARAPGKSGFADAVARYLFKLMAYKDEYEVARLYTDGAFEKQVKTEFDGDSLRYEFHLAPPLLARRDKSTGLPRKMSFGPWLLPAFRVLAKLKFLRGTSLDPFGRSAERRTERRLIEDYEATLGEVLAGLTPENHPIAVGLAAIPEKIRGFGHVKQQHLVAAKANETALLEQFRAGAPMLLKAAE